MAGLTNYQGRFVIYTLWLLLFAGVLAGCGGGSKKSDSGANPDQPRLTLSHSRRAPGHMVSVFHPSIQAGQVVDVSFDAQNGYQVTAAAALSEDGYALIAVPPYVSVSGQTVNYSSGTVKVSIAGVADSVDLAIEALPDVSQYQPGEVTLAIIDENLATNLALRERLQQIAASTGANLDTWSADLLAQYDSLLAAKAEIMAGQLEIETPAGTTRLGVDAIRVLDEINLSYIQGLQAYLVEQGAASVLAKQGVDFSLRGALLAIKNQGIPGLQVLGSYVTVGLAGAAAVSALTAPVTGPAGPATGVVIAAYSGGVALIVTAGTGLTSFFTELALDAYDGRDPDFSNAANEALEVSYQSVASIGLTFAGGVNWVGQSLSSLLSAAIDTRSGVKGLRDLLCLDEADRMTFKADLRQTAEPDQSNVEKYCAETDVAYPVGLTLTSAPQELLINEAGTWEVSVFGGELPYLVTFRWGDGSSEGQGAGGTSSSASHAYQQAGEYSVTVVASDANSMVSSVQSSVTVLPQLSIAWAGIPQQLQTNQAGSWAITILGGKPPYALAMQWGDGSSESSAGEGSLTLAHAYAEAGNYTVTATVTDEAGASEELSATVAVETVIVDECMDVSGEWAGTVSFSVSCTDLEDGSTNTDTGTAPAQVVLTQVGCSVTGMAANSTISSGSVIGNQISLVTTNSTGTGSGTITGSVQGNSMQISSEGNVITEGLSCTETSSGTLLRQ